jgi:hypothetical protein
MQTGPCGPPRGRGRAPKAVGSASGRAGTRLIWTPTPPQPRRAVAGGRSSPGIRTRRSTPGPPAQVAEERPTVS